MQWQSYGGTSPHRVSHTHLEHRQAFLEAFGLDILAFLLLSLTCGVLLSFGFLREST
jgi:hypothetical protein